MRQLAAILVIISCIGCSSPNSNGTKSESIVYLKSKDDNIDLYKSDVLGKWEDRLTTNAGWDWSPKWIPALKQFTYYSRNEAGEFSWLKKSKGTDTPDTLGYADLLNPQLSPDGKYVYFLEQDGIAQNVKRVPLAGGLDEYVTYSSSHNSRFEIDKTHSRVAFISNRSESNQLHLIDLESRERTQLTFVPMIAKYSSFSPDGKQIAVCLAMPSEDPKWDIYIINIESGEQRQLTKTPYSEQEIAWSLSGDKIAFHATSENDGDQIYTIDIADGKFTKITSGDYYHGEPAWVLF